MMDIYEIMKQRHSVRQYEDKKIEPDKRTLLLEEIDKINKEGHLHIQILIFFQFHEYHKLQFHSLHNQIYFQYLPFEKC